MLTLLFKMSIIWTVLLVLYFVALSQERAARWNRFYLWLALSFGLVIPLLKNPFLLQQNTKDTTSLVWQSTVGMSSNIEMRTQVTPPSNDANWTIILFYAWIIGAALQSCLLLRNAIHLFLLKKRSAIRRHPIATYHTSDKITAPFSFGKTIFLPVDSYNSSELNLILQHEKGHYIHRHWVDNLFLELLQILFWPHPLFHVFKKQIKLVHEYEVDASIAIDDRYDYGKLLLAQNNKNYTNALVHTFNFSPLKKRIAMMTTTKKVNKWKFVMALPFMVLCFTLMSAQTKFDERNREGNVTTFRGNTILWSGIQQNEVAVMDPVTNKPSRISVTTEDKIIQCNGKDVKIMESREHSHDYDDVFARKIATNIYENLEGIKGELPEAIAQLQIVNLILDKSGAPVYYDVFTLGSNPMDTSVGGLNRFPAVNEKVDKILSNKNMVNPENLTSDNDYGVIWVGLPIKTLSFNAKKLTPDESEKFKKEKEARAILEGK